MATSVSVFGLGIMGRPMARTLIARGFDVRGWNRSPLPADLVEGIPLASSLEEAARAEVLLLMLADSDAVDAVLSRLDPSLRPGHLVVDMGSSDPSRSEAHARRLAARGIGWVDAPVSGGPEGAAAGSLAIMAGGTPEDFARARPVLDALGGNVVRVGGPGAGHTVKVINQLIVGLTIEAVAEALTLAERSGIDPRLVQQALRGGFADSKILQIHGTRMIERAYVPGGKVKTQLKDLRLALALAARLGLRLPHLESAAARYDALVRRGDGELDHSALHRLLWQEHGGAGDP
ncbi:MAG: NAD(P)-dependent oxidoreductase [Armatimonadota bacterium]|nr:NAD(P)-dependent oxidoreductase [Armatimonadota bacterium]MDR7549590.1 NAD(P)-dependent oxidoreductase [Armatimonadota bacterium]